MPTFAMLFRTGVIQENFVKVRSFCPMYIWNICLCAISTYIMTLCVLNIKVRPCIYHGSDALIIIMGTVRGYYSNGCLHAFCPVYCYMCFLFFFLTMLAIMYFKDKWMLLLVYNNCLSVHINHFRMPSNFCDLTFPPRICFLWSNKDWW
jgi:hypothetical protein